MANPTEYEDLVKALMGLGTLDQRTGQLDANMLAAQALRARPHQTFKTGPGGMAAALGGGIGAIGSGISEWASGNEKQGLLDQADKVRLARALATHGALPEQGPIAADANNPYSLNMALDEASAMANAQQQVAALRNQQHWSQLDQMTGDKTLGNYGKGQQDSYEKGQDRLSDAGKYRLTNSLAVRTATDKAAADQAKAGNDISEGMRKEFLGNQVVKTMQEVSASWDKIQKAAANPTAAGDLSLIFGYMKMLDPGSTVREGEFANAQNATGIPDQVMNMYNRALTGKRLGPEQRADFTTQAEGLYSAHLARFKPFADQFSALAQRKGVAPEDVVLDLGFQPAAKETKPATQATDHAPATRTINGETRTWNGKEWVK